VEICFKSDNQWDVVAQCYSEMSTEGNGNWICVNVRGCVILLLKLNNVPLFITRFCVVYDYKKSASEAFWMGLKIICESQKKDYDGSGERMRWFK